MAFKMKGSPMKRNFDVGSSPAKHKMEAHPTYHGAGGVGWVDEVTAEQVKAHDDEYGEGHTHPKKGLYSLARKPRGLRKILRKLTDEEKIKVIEKTKKKNK